MYILIPEILDQKIWLEMLPDFQIISWSSGQTLWSVLQNS